jgi:hypothetical protein
VVGCAPVPKARPGSITIAIAPAGGSSHGGPTHSPAIATPRWNAFQRSSQSSATSAAWAPPKAWAISSSPRPSVYATSSTLSAPSISSKPPGKSSSIVARASSARAKGTVTETRRSRVSGTRS